MHRPASRWRRGTRTHIPPPDRRHGACNRYAPQSLAPSSLRSARTAPAATCRCAARSLRSSLCSALARSAWPREGVQRLRPCTGWLARVQRRPCDQRSPHASRSATARGRLRFNITSPIPTRPSLAGFVSPAWRGLAGLSRPRYIMCRFAPGGRRRLVRVAATGKATPRAGSLTAKHTLCKVAACAARSEGVPAARLLCSRHYVHRCCAWVRRPGFVSVIATRLNVRASPSSLVAAVACSAAHSSAHGRCAWAHRLSFVDVIATRQGAHRHHSYPLLAGVVRGWCRARAVKDCASSLRESLTALRAARRGYPPPAINP